MGLLGFDVDNYCRFVAEIIYFSNIYFQLQKELSQDINDYSQLIPIINYKGVFRGIGLYKDLIAFKNDGLWGLMDNNFNILKKNTLYSAPFVIWNSYLYIINASCVKYGYGNSMCYEEEKFTYKDFINTTLEHGILSQKIGLFRCISN